MTNTKYESKRGPKFTDGKFIDRAARIKYVKTLEEAAEIIGRLTHCEVSLPLLTGNSEREDGLVISFFKRGQITLEARMYKNFFALNGIGKVCNVSNFDGRPDRDEKSLKEMVDKAFAVAESNYEADIITGPKEVTKMRQWDQFQP